MRKQLHKVELWFTDGSALPIVIATSYLDRLPDIIEKHKPIYQRQNKNIMGWQLTSTMPTLQMTDQEYADELVYVDIDNEE